jgi:hypothetical protein
MDRPTIWRVRVDRVSWQLVLALALTLLLSGLPASAQEDRTAAPEIEEKAMTILKRMAEFLSQAQRFSVTVEVGSDVVQDWGQKVEFGETRKIVVRRPDRARINTVKRDGTVSDFVFDGKEIAVSHVQDKVYATAAKPGTLDEAIAYFVNDLDMRLPLGELLTSNLPKILQDRVKSVYYVEQAAIAGVPCDHLALRGDRVDLQFWIAQGDQPLPRRMVITYTREEGQPQFWAQFSEWNLSPEVPDSLFVFTPPDGAMKIAFAPRRRDGTETPEQKGEVQ